jgi:actin-like ATPase involved in cell morphogenesis
MHRHASANVNKSRELDRLVGRVEQILACLPQDQSAEMDALRDKVDRTIMATWLALGSEPPRAAIRHHRRILDVAAAILVGIAAGSLMRRML